MAGFFVFAKSGFILSLRICSTTDQKVFWSGHVSVAKVSRTSVDFAWLSWEVHRSLADVKLASAMMMSCALEAFLIGSIGASEARRDTASIDFSRLSRISASLPVDGLAIRYQL